MIKKIFFASGFLLVLFFLYIGFSPSEYQIEKSVKIYSAKEFLQPYFSSVDRLQELIKVSDRLEITETTENSVVVTEASGEKKTFHRIGLLPIQFTVLNWQKTGEMNFFQKLKAFFSSPEAVVGAEMAEQLQSLRDQVEADLKAKEQ